MLKPFCSAGIAGEPVDWSLISQQADDGMIKSVYEAPCAPLDRTYHLVTIECNRLDAQHLSII